MLSPDITELLFCKAVDVFLEKGGQCKMVRPLPFLVLCLNGDSGLGKTLSSLLRSAQD